MNDKKIGLGSVIATGVGLVVASSCLLTLGIGAGSIGTPFIITMIIACCVNIFTLLSIAELNSMMPDLTGGLAQFSLACVGPFITIICMVGGYLLCNSLAGSVEGAVFGNTFAEMFAGLGLPAWVFSLVLIAFLAITNLNGVDVFIKVQDFVAYALIFSLAAMGVLGALGIGTGEVIEQPAALATDFKSVTGLCGLAFFLFVGGEYVIPLNKSCKNAKRDIPLGMVLSMLIILAMQTLLCLLMTRWLQMSDGGFSHIVNCIRNIITIKKINIMSKLKLMIVMGTRPEIIKLSEIVKKCDKYFDLKIVHTGQNYDYNLNKLFFEELGLREPDFYLGVVGDNLGQTMGNVLAKSYELFDAEKPDAILVLGDTNSCLCVISAKRLKIPIFHLEAGNRCKDENLPEEVIRRIVDVTSDVNLCYSENARRYILDQGLTANIDKINNSDVLTKLGLEPRKYILLSAHREENIDIESNFFSLMNAVNAMAEKYDMPILYSCHPRSKKYIEQRGFKFDKRVIQHQPLGFFDYNKLQQNAFCVVSDSGTIPEEGSYFKFPAVSIRTSTERPEAMDKGVFTIGSITSEYVLQAVDLAVSMWQNGDAGLTVPAYSDENVSTKVVKIIQSYVGIVNKMIWRKA